MFLKVKESVNRHIRHWNTAIEASPKGSVDCVETWGTDFREDLKHIDVPTLVIHGDQDRIVPFPNSGKHMPDFVKASIYLENS